MNKIILDHCIEGKPNFSLKGCLAHYDNSRLVALADKQHLIVNMGGPINLETLNRKVLIESLLTHIYAHVKEDLFYLPPREIEFVCKLISAGSKEIDNIDYEDCKFLHSLGYVHLYNYNGKIYPVIPKELRKIYNTIAKGKLENETKLNNRLYDYAIALTQIHGIYTVEHFVEVWNAYNEDKVDFEKALRYLDMMYDRQDYFTFDYQYVVTNYPSNDYGYKLLDGDRERTYHIPEKSQIELYSQLPARAI